MPAESLVLPAARTPGASFVASAAQATGEAIQLMLLVTLCVTLQLLRAWPSADVA